MSKQPSKWHWDIRIKEYLASGWSHAPSEFAREVQKNLKTSAQLLELGAGAGQDSLWFASQGNMVELTDAFDVGFNVIANRIPQNIKERVNFAVVDASQSLPYENQQFDCVYAQLSIHYFNDDVTHLLFSEIHRILKPGGIVAVMMNTTKDAEYDESKLNAEGLLDVNGLMKRYFSIESLAPFVVEFEPLLFDDRGRTPKDDEKHNSGMIRFIGRKA